MGSLLYGSGLFGAIALSVGLFVSVLTALEVGRLVWQWQVNATGTDLNVQIKN
ncbi:hypothetical protein D9X30_3291 [Cupriavidus sp. U2]|uniref:hypothetical protein n=1 Tax=Cupriavidus sp. U2 TaxID=2920269 RepID=UPI00129E8098|nr:hypothetical protein [Cupriavidus sp. U2]KAI3591766.1 hypothetical protein D9X30_3291 [Cupriavidus sp. U2]